MKKSDPSSWKGAKNYPMKFCPSCRNLLCPKEDKKSKMLVIACRTCSYQEKAEINCVIKHEKKQYEQPLILRDAYEDPTLPRAKDVSCIVCGHPRVVYFVANNKESLAQTFACCNPICGHNWRNDDQDSG